MLSSEDLPPEVPRERDDIDGSASPVLELWQVVWDLYIYVFFTGKSLPVPKKSLGVPGPCTPPRLPRWPGGNQTLSWQLLQASEEREAPAPNGGRILSDPRVPKFTTSGWGQKEFNCKQVISCSDSLGMLQHVSPVLFQRGIQYSLQHVSWMWKEACSQTRLWGVEYVFSCLFHSSIHPSPSRSVSSTAPIALSIETLFLDCSPKISARNSRTDASNSLRHRRHRPGSSLQLKVRARTSQGASLTSTGTCPCFSEHQDRHSSKRSSQATARDQPLRSHHPKKCGS